MKKAAFFLAAILALLAADAAQAGGLSLNLFARRQRVIVEEVRVRPVIVEQVRVQQVRVQQVRVQQVKVQQVRVQPVVVEEVVEVPAVRQVKQVRVIERNRLCD